MGIGGEVGLGIGAFLAFLSVPGAGSWVKRNTYWVKRLTLGVRVLLKQKKIEKAWERKKVTLGFSD